MDTKKNRVYTLFSLYLQVYICGVMIKSAKHFPHGVISLDSVVVN